MITILIHCYSYQHRLCWMLSSLLQQVSDIPIINISYCPNNGNPTTEDVIKYFTNKGLIIDSTILTEAQMSNRSIARNIQTKEAKTDWLLYSDCDLVFEPTFFKNLNEQLKTNLKDIKLVMGADRISLDINFCQNYFIKDLHIYPIEVPFASAIVNKWPVKRIGGKHQCAGYFQLANTEAIKAKGGVYCNRERDLWRNTKSDRRFRIMMGGRLGITTGKIWHLNHDRTLGEQR